MSFSQLIAVGTAVEAASLEPPKVLGKATSIPEDGRGELLAPVHERLRTGDLATSALGEAIRWHLGRSEQCVIFEPTESDVFVEEVKHWALATNSLWISGVGILDRSGKMIVPYSSEDQISPEAQLPFLAESVQRQQQTRVQLTNRLVDPPEGLWPIPSSVEIAPREAGEIARRALALFAVGVRAESVLNGQPISVAIMHNRCEQAFDEFSPIEKRLFMDPPDSRQCELLVWRYEALMALQWAVGMQLDLPWPDERCELASVTRLMIDFPDDEIVAHARLRPLVEILDASELHFQMWHAIAAAQAAGKEPPGGLDPGIVAERVVSLFWILRLHAHSSRGTSEDSSTSWEATVSWVEDGMRV